MAWKDHNDNTNQSPSLGCSEAMGVDDEERPFKERERDARGNETSEKLTEGTRIASTNLKRWGSANHILRNTSIDMDRHSTNICIL